MDHKINQVDQIYDTSPAGVDPEKAKKAGEVVYSTSPRKSS